MSLKTNIHPCLTLINNAKNYVVNLVGNNQVRKSLIEEQPQFKTYLFHSSSTKFIRKHATLDNVGSLEITFSVNSIFVAYISKEDLTNTVDKQVFFILFRD